MKHLIVCADGTWCTPDQEENGIPTPTNVVKLHNCLAGEAEISDNGRMNSVEQRRYYHPGVGTAGGILKRVAGGIWGEGLSQNIESAYKWLACNYEADDRIFLFGFSRGAYTVRSLGGLLNICGLLDLAAVAPTEAWRRVETAYKRGYRARRAHSEWAEDWAFHQQAETPIRFIGVWDTVGALGIPDDLAILNLFDRPRNWRFHNTTLGKNVQTARHAMALDEFRASFTSTLWKKPPRSSDVRQIWFPGSHSDVGGGYPDTSLSDGALLWMIEQASQAGLVFQQHALEQIQPNPRGLLHESLKGIFRAHRSRPRNTPPVAANDVHPSAKHRHAAPPISQAPYRPTIVLAKGDSKTVDIYAREQWNCTTIYLKRGKYLFSAEGEWLDKAIPCGPEGTADGEFHIGEIPHLIGTGIGWLEHGWHGATGHEGADFKMTRRHEQWPWFALVGAVANSARKPTEDGTPPPHESFMIGSKNTYRLKRGGYLYAYANDAWDFYDNNRGSVRLTVKCVALDR